MINKKILKFKRLADRGNVESMYEYGVSLYLETPDYETALKYLLKAASYDFEPAYGDLGIIYYFEMDNPETAEEWFLKAEETNCLYPPAAYHYGMLISFEKNNDEEALKYLYKAAEGEFELSYGEIGSIFYYKGDLTNAQEWFIKAEEANCLLAPSAYNYGMLYLDKDNEDKALEYLIAAAEGEYDLAYEELGYIYEKRNEIEKSEMWYQKAADATI